MYLKVGRDNLLLITTVWLQEMRRGILILKGPWHQNCVLNRHKSTQVSPSDRLTKAAPIELKFSALVFSVELLKKYFILFVYFFIWHQ
jgi:hypothetical protein